MGHDCMDPQTCPVCRTERSAGIDMAPTVAMPLTENELGDLRLRTGGGPFFAAQVGIPRPAVAASEHERDETTDRDRVRKIVLGAVDVFLSTALNTPCDRPLDVSKLWSLAAESAVPAVREFRSRRAPKLPR